MKIPARVPILLASVLLLFTASHKPDSYVVGDKVEDFLLKNVDGRMISLKDFPDAKGYIVIFTCNHCPYAQLYEQRIINLHRKFNPKGFPVIAINPNDPKSVPEDSYEEMIKRAADKRFPYVYLFDAEQKVYPKFGAIRTPHVFVLNQEKIVRYIGAIDDNPETPSSVHKKYVENAIEAILRGERPNPNYTRAIGCPIKRKRN